MICVELQINSNPLLWYSWRGRLRIIGWELNYFLRISSLNIDYLYKINCDLIKYQL